MSSRDDHDEPQRRLRVPAALAVAFVGSSAMVSMWYGGCDPGLPDPTPDSGRIEMKADAELPDDGGVLVDDAAVDAGAPDARIDAPPAELPPDASDPPH